MSLHDWSRFLIEQGAHYTEERVSHFALDALREKHRALGEHSLCDLSHYGLIRVRGEEAGKFLQNQFSNDVRLVSADKSQLNAYCNPKGRALAFFRLFEREGQFYLRLPHELLEPTLKRLRLYLLMTKAVLEDASQDLVRFGYAGPQAAERLQSLLGDAPAAVDAACLRDGVSVLRVPGPLPRFELYGPLAAMTALWRQLAAAAAPVGHGSWDLFDIEAGLPEVYAATVEAFVPQMLNLQAIDALSFKKGCYPGQEIVARMQYLGTLKRRMFLARAAADEVPAPGDGLFAEDDASGQAVGKVVRATSHPDGGVAVLAVIEIASSSAARLHLKNADGPLMKLENLPYMLGETN